MLRGTKGTQDKQSPNTWRKEACFVSSWLSQTMEESLSKSICSESRCELGKLCSPPSSLGVVVWNQVGWMICYPETHCESLGLITQNNYSYTSYSKWMESDTLLLHCLQGSEKLCKKNLPYRKVCSYPAPFLLHFLYHHEIRAYYLQMFQKDIPSFPVAYFTSSQSIHQNLKCISALLFCWLGSLRVGTRIALFSVYIPISNFTADVSHDHNENMMNKWPNV